ncbi:MAG: hypothetical protein ACSHW0_17045 [Thalassotalea sp.]
MEAKEKYLNGLNDLFTSYFEQLKNNCVDIELKQRIQGYIQAGEVAEFITRDDSTSLMGEVHQAVLGETIDERKIRKEKIKKTLQHFDADYLNVPAITRKNNPTLQPKIIKPEEYVFCLTSSSGIHCGECEGCLNLI